MKYIGIKPFREFSNESLLVYADGIDRHGVFFEYKTSPTPTIRYIYIEQPNVNPLYPGKYHAFEVNLSANSSNLDDTIQMAKDFAVMIISFKNQYIYNSNI